MATPRVTFRCQPELRDKLENEAKRRGIETGELIRSILGKAMAVKVQPLAEGFAGIDPEIAAEIRSKGGKKAAEIRAEEKKSRKSSRRKSNAA